MVVALLAFALVGQRAELAELDALVAQYKRYKLPLPPKTAPLVQTNTVGTGAGDKATYGYLLPKKDEYGRAVALIGTQEGSTESTTPVKATKAAAARAYLGGSSGGDGIFDQETGVWLAVCEHARGHDEFAIAILKKAKSGETLARPYWLSGGKTARERLAFFAVTHWLNELSKPGTDWVSISENIEAIKQRAPVVNTELVKYYATRVKKTVTGRYQGDDLDERLIDELCDLSHIHGSFFSMFADVGPDKTPALLMRIPDRGFEIVPDLIAHRNDERLTRTGWLGFNNFGPRLLTVGELCKLLLTEFSEIGHGLPFLHQGNEGKLESWWDAASDEGEREYLKRKLAKPAKEFPSGLLIYVAESRHPDILAGAYETLLRETPKSQSWVLLDAVLRAVHGKPEKIRLLEIGASHANLNHVHSALWKLKDLEPALFDKHLLAVLKRLPRSPTGPAWLSQEGSFAQQVAQSSSPQVWAALTQATKRAEVNLRLALLEKSCDAKFDEVRRRLALTHLLQFFDDASTAVKKKPTDEDPFADDGLPFLDVKRVQDLAAALAARELRIGPEPAPKAPRAQWDKFRQRVRGAVSNLDRVSLEVRRSATEVDEAVRQALIDMGFERRLIAGRIAYTKGYRGMASGASWVAIVAKEKVVLHEYTRYELKYIEIEIDGPNSATLLERVRALLKV
jgi:hypothetical protein